jgi:hypothetical protein
MALILTMLTPRSYGERGTATRGKPIGNGAAGLYFLLVVRLREPMPATPPRESGRKLFEQLETLRFVPSGLGSPRCPRGHPAAFNGPTLRHSCCLAATRMTCCTDLDRRHAAEAGRWQSAVATGCASTAPGVADDRLDLAERHRRRACTARGPSQSVGAAGCGEEE